MFCSRYFLRLLATFLYFAKIALTSVHPDEIWSYSGNTAPENWHTTYPKCGGSSQSPINIQTKEVEVNATMGNIDLQPYAASRQLNMTLLNNGHSVEVDVHGHPPEIRGGGLPGIYKVVQFHFHWGHDNRRGSEHLINGHANPMEMHIVHYNTIYGNMSAAAQQADGLAVLGFFIEVGPHNYKFDEIVNHLIDIAHKDDFRIIKSFSLLSLLPKNPKNFWRYHGSLTTPPCYESVVWTLFEDKIIVSQEQIEQFRHNVHKNYEGDNEQLLVDDYRPIQRLNGRTVYANNYFGSGATSLHHLWLILAVTVALVFFTTRSYM